MHHLFMIVVILALLPAAVATALALGQILFYVLIAAAILLAAIFLLANPNVLLGLLGAAAIFIVFILAGLGAMWVAARVERNWPGILHRLGFGSASLLCALITILVPLASSKQDTSNSELLSFILFFGGVASALGWWAMKAKPTDTTKWFKA